MRDSLDKKYAEGTITNEEKHKLSLIYWIKNGIFLGLYLFMVIFSLVKIKRSVIFFSILSNGKAFSFYTLTLVLFYISLYIVFIFLLFSIGYMVYKTIKKEDWMKAIHSFHSKVDLPVYVGKCLSILLFIMVYVATPCNVFGSSMNNTFDSGDKVLCIDLYSHPEVGDIVVFDAMNYTNKDSFYIKRIMAVSGDTISYDVVTSTAYVNDEAFNDITLEGFTKMRNSIGITDGKSFTIPEGYSMVLGDNRGLSMDSRSFGLIQNEDIFGRVFLRLYPFNKIHSY